MESAPSLTELLHTVLDSFIDLCTCDGGSIYTMRKNEAGEPVLIFETMETRSIRLHGVPGHLKNLTFKLSDNTLVSRTARERRLHKMNLESGGTGTSSPRVDNILQYQTYNMMSAPLITPRGDLVGVVQLINKLPHPGPGGALEIPDFDTRDERMFTIVATQAALAIENSMLLDEQEKLLEGFVNACVTAVEARDPVTSGHSERVSGYTIGLSEAVSRTQTGPLALINFSPTQVREIRYAAMLHDIGKISVKEDVLNKERKLHPWQLEVIRMRLKLMRSHLLLEQLSGKHDHRKKIAQLDRAWQMIVTANEPAVLPAEVDVALHELEHLKIKTDEGEVYSALTRDEGFKLAIRKGSLTTSERHAIEQHVTNTFEILRMVPWSRGLESVPEIAYRHHEKLNGSGYPLGVKAVEIPIQSRIITVCDIYDALTADDRPYKRALSGEKALDILSTEVREGKLDADCFKVFLEARIFELYADRIASRKRRQSGKKQSQAA